MIAVQAAVSISKNRVVLSQSYVIRSRTRSTQLSVPHQHRHRHPPGSGMKPRQLQRLILSLAFAFVPPVLKPDFDLCGCEFEDVGQVFPLRGGQVALLSEATLQLGHLGLREEDPGLPALQLGPDL